MQQVRSASNLTIEGLANFMNWQRRARLGWAILLAVGAFGAGSGVAAFAQQSDAPTTAGPTLAVPSTPTRSAANGTTLQPPGASPRAETGAQPLAEWLGNHPRWRRIGPIVLVVVLIGGVVLWFRRQHPSQPDATEPTFIESEADPSKFEQIQAEIQGLHLRLLSGQQEGDFHKIEKLARVLIEKLGCPGARQMDPEQLHEVIHSGLLTPAQATTLSSILERCQRGLAEPSRELDFDPPDLLWELNELIRSIKQTPSEPSP